MIYDKRNRATLDELAPNTKVAALKWYDYCIKVGAEILIYDARRTIEEQKANVASGASKTMNSYHIVGQALDFVPVNSKGVALWDRSNYSVPKIQDIIRYAKSLGFESGYDWGWDAPHLEFKYKGYGTDKVLEQPIVKEEVKVTTQPKVTHVTITVKGKDVPGIIIDGKSYMAVVETCQALNATQPKLSADWNAELGKVEVK